MAKGTIGDISALKRKWVRNGLLLFVIGASAFGYVCVAREDARHRDFEHALWDIHYVNELVTKRAATRHGVLDSFDTRHLPTWVVAFAYKVGGPEGVKHLRRVASRDWAYRVPPNLDGKKLDRLSGNGYLIETVAVKRKSPMTGLTLSGKLAEADGPKP